MKKINNLFDILGVKNILDLKRLSDETGISKDKLKHYNENNLLPMGNEMERLVTASGITKFELMLRMGILDQSLLKTLKNNASKIYEIIKGDLCEDPIKNDEVPELVLKTDYGRLYKGDCLDLMRDLEDNSVDLIFADPPFNLKKLYPSKINDNLKKASYLHWCEKWATECARLLKPGGSLFLWNLPKWNIHLAGYLNHRLTFRHWIAVDIKYSLPIPGRLYPSHYSLLYYCKGEKPSTFHPDRFPMDICPKCMADLKDYGGYKDKMNPKGVNLSDVWLDIPPVRHAKYKKRNGSNELSIKLLDRILEMSSNEGDLIFDPFGGSGSTYAVAEIKKRKWIGIEIGPEEEIVQRFEELIKDEQHLQSLRKNYNCLFTDESLEKRHRLGLWTHETVRKIKKGHEQLKLV